MFFVYTVITTVLQAFTTKTRNLLFYLVNHGKFLQKDGRFRRSTTNEIQAWRDEVHKSVMMNCFLVDNIVKKFNNCKGNSRSARDARIMALSELACGFSYKTILSLPLRLPDVGTFKNRTISKNMFYEARNHAAAYLPGRPAFYIPHTRKVSISGRSLQLAIQWLLDPDNIQKVCLLRLILVGFDVS